MKKDVCYFKECVRGFVVNITKRFHIRNYFLIIIVVTKQSYILTLIQKRKMLFGSNFLRNVYLLHSKLFPLCLQWMKRWKKTVREYRKLKRNILIRFILYLISIAEHIDCIVKVRNEEYQDNITILYFNLINKPYISLH